MCPARIAWPPTVLVRNGISRRKSRRSDTRSVDLVADRTDGVDALAGGVVELPVEVALAGVERALVATAHRDDDVGGLRRLRRSAASGARRSRVEVDADLGHRFDDSGVDRVGGRGACGAHDDPVAGVVA